MLPVRDCAILMNNKGKRVTVTNNQTTRGNDKSRYLNVRLEDAGDVRLLEQTFLSEFCRSTFHFNEQHVL